MMKKIFSVFLILLYLCFFTGCSMDARVLGDLAESVLDLVTADDMYGVTLVTTGDDRDYADLVTENGWYDDVDTVAAYLIVYDELPDNYLTKDEAEDLGWVQREGNLWDVADGMSIGGDYFGNYEGLLPDGRYAECDIDYDGGARGGERLVYTTQGDLYIYYTDDHYESFQLIYAEE